MAVKQYDAYICPKCGDELSVYDVEPFSITDVGAERSEHSGNYICTECELDYELIKTVAITEARESLVEEFVSRGIFLDRNGFAAVDAVLQERNDGA